MEKKFTQGGFDSSVQTEEEKCMNKLIEATEDLSKSLKNFVSVVNEVSHKIKNVSEEPQCLNLKQIEFAIKKALEQP